MLSCFFSLHINQSYEFSLKIPIRVLVRTNVWHLSCQHGSAKTNRQTVSLDKQATGSCFSSKWEAPTISTTLTLDSVSYNQLIGNLQSWVNQLPKRVKAFRFPIKILKRQALHFDARFKLTSTFEQLKVKFDFEPNVSESRKNIKCMNVHGRSAGALEWEISQKDSKLKASAMCLKSKNKPPWRGCKTKLFPSKYIWIHFKVREIIMFDFASYARRTIDVWDVVGRENGENEHWLMIWSGGRGKKQCKYSEPGMMVFLSACPGFIIHSLLLLYSHFPFYWNDAIKCLPLIYHSSIFTFIVFINYLLFFFIQVFTYVTNLLIFYFYVINPLILHTSFIL